MFAERSRLAARLGIAAALSLALGSCETVTTAVTVPVAQVEVTPPGSSLFVGGTVQLAATMTAEGGQLLKDRAATWSSSDVAVVTVDASGLVTAVGGGSATITATSEGQVGTTDVTVAIPIAGLSVSPTTVTVAEGQSVAITASPVDASGNLLTNRLVTWSSSDPSIATVQPSSPSVPRVASVFGIDPGTVTITALSEGRTATATVTVQAPIASIDVTPASDTVLVGDTLRLTATPRDSGGAALSDRTVTWSSSNTAVATVDSAGLVTAIDIDGRLETPVTISATAEGQTGSSLLTVTVVFDTLSAGDLVASSIDVAGEVDYYGIDAASGDRISLTLVETSGFPSTSAPQLTVFSPTGSQVTTATANTQPLLTLPADGIHLVRIRANNLVSIGGYSLGLEGLAPVSSDSVSIELGDLLPGAIGSAGETDLFTFDASASDRVLVSLVETSGFPSTAAPYMTVYAPSGVVVSGLSYTANTERLLNLPEDGKYVVSVRANNLVSIGGYSLGLEGLAPVSPDSVSIAPGDLLPGTIGSAGETDLFTFDATANDRVLMTLVETSGFASTTAPYMTVYAPSGAVVNGLSYTANSQPLLNLPESGKYVVTIRANNLVTTGGYTLGLEGLTPVSPDSVSIAPGDLLPGTIGSAGETDLFTFDATANDRVLMTLVETSGFASTTAPYMTVYAPSGAVVSGLSYTANSQPLLTLPESGKYVVTIRANNLVTTGGYTLGLEGLTPVSPDSVSIAPGDLLPGTIGSAGETDLFTFDATANDRVLMTLVETSGFASTTAPYMTIYAPSGVVVSGLSYTANAQPLLTLPESGKYVVTVRANNLVTTGGYSLGLEGLSPVTPGTTALNRTDVVSGSIASAGATDLYTFSATAGENLDVTLTETGGFASTTAPRGLLIAPSGVIVGSAFDGTTVRSFTSLPETGVYVIRIAANNLVTTGTYDLEVQ